MPALKNNKWFTILIGLAVFSFAFLAVGGPFLHDVAHHHNDGTEQTCPLYHLLLQALISVIVVLAGAILPTTSRFIQSYHFVYSRASRALIPPRGPPTLA